MVNIYYATDTEIQKAEGAANLEIIPLKKICWVDLFYPTEEEIKKLESVFHINSTQLKAENELENNARFYESEDLVFISANFTSVKANSFKSTPVFLYLLHNILITERNEEVATFDDTIKKMLRNRKAFKDGSAVLEGILETKSDVDADFLEYMAREIVSMTRKLNIKASVDKEEMLLKISEFQEATALSRESFVDKQRVVSALLKCSVFENKVRFKILLKDINAMLDYTTFIFMRLEFLQNTVLGLINLDQNKIIKLFTIMTVIFLPPTLISSIYGMNFKEMPELEWYFGYPLAIMLIILSSGFTLFIFKSKKWL